VVRAPALRRVLFLGIQHQHAALNPLRIDTGLFLQVAGKLSVSALANGRHAVNRCGMMPWVERRQDTAARPRGLAPELTPFEQQHAHIRFMQTACGEHADETAADDDAVEPGGLARD
jgi:hypothetical protein